MQRNGELSVEEILESIKKVIARDNKDTAETVRYRRETEGVVLRGPGSNFGLMPVADTVNDDEESREEPGKVAEEDLAGEYDLDAEADAEVLDLGDAATELLDDEDAGSDDLPLATDPQFAVTTESTATDLGEDGDSEPPESETLASETFASETLASETLDSETLDLQETEEEQAVAAYPASTISEPTREALVTMPESSDSPFAASSPTGETPIERMVRESLRPMLREWLDTNLPPIVEQMVKTELERIMGKSH